MATKAKFNPLIPVEYVNIAPNKIVQYTMFEGANRRKPKALPKLAPGEKLEIKPLLPPTTYEGCPHTKAIIQAGIDDLNEEIIKHNNRVQNLLDNKPEAMSKSARKRVIAAVNAFYVLSQPKQYEYDEYRVLTWKQNGKKRVPDMKEKTGRKLKSWFRLNFVTLTLCAAQAHDDKFIKSEMLDPFLERLRRKHDMKSYIWRAERQKNGNIHFHITTNIYLPHDLIRKYWNEIQLRHGYIAAYISSGGNDNPNSTDVHAVKEVKNLAAYLCKYLAKETPVGEKPIEGRQWFLSANLSKVKPITELFQCELRDELLRFEASQKNKFRKGKDGYAYVMFADIFESDLVNYPTLSRLRAQWFEQYSSTIN